MMATDAEGIFTLARQAIDSGFLSEGCGEKGFQMILSPKVASKKFDDCEPGELVKLLVGHTGESALGVVATRENERKEPEQLVVIISSNGLKYQYYTRGETVLSFGHDWELLLTDFSISVDRELGISSGSVGITQSALLWVMGAGSPERGGWQALSLSDWKIAYLGHVPPLARGWSIRLAGYPEGHPSAVPLETMIGNV